MFIHLKIVGALLISLSLFHVIFPKYFNWKRELGELSLINRQMMTTHTFFIALTLILMGILCLHSTDNLLKTELGRTITSGLAFFWVTRLFFQLFVYSAKLWKGKRFETSVHLIFTFIWIYFSSVFVLSSINYSY